jgi:sulfur-oxidizing protein SoxZ
VLIEHEMENGLRKGTDGALVPAWYVKRVQADLNGQRVFDARWGPSVSKNPMLRFSLREGQLGDRITVTWLDNRGHTRTDHALVA